MAATKDVSVGDDLGKGQVDGSGILKAGKQGLWLCVERKEAAFAQEIFLIEVQMRRDVLRWGLLMALAFLARLCSRSRYMIRHGSTSRDAKNLRVPSGTTCSPPRQVASLPGGVRTIRSCASHDLDRVDLSHCYYEVLSHVPCFPVRLLPLVLLHPFWRIPLIYLDRGERAAIHRLISQPVSSTNVHENSV
jgi:hypothetical protein